MSYPVSAIRREEESRAEHGPLRGVTGLMPFTIRKVGPCVVTVSSLMQPCVSDREAAPAVRAADALTVHSQAARWSAATVARVRINDAGSREWCVADGA